MARLTEPDTSSSTGETIDSLKRKFLRQNRDLIRTNATQSAKIRSLEIQISNLLAENLSFRDTVIHLQVELDESRHRTVIENVNTVQKQLEEKLRECTGIVAQLGQVQKKSRSYTAAAKERYPDQREWRTRATLSEILETQPGHLPTIIEGKHYPRKTLDANDINTIISEASTSSPDAGTPPQTRLVDRGNDRDHFEHTADVQQDTRGRRESGLLSANFETRKRRRETYVKPDEDISSLQVSNTVPDLAFLKTPERLSGKPIRAARKRRVSAQQVLDVRDDGIRDFEYTKRDVPATGVPNNDVHSTITTQQEEAQVVLDSRPLMPLSTASQPGLSPQRLVLGSKTTNMSPRKTVPRTDSQKEPNMAQTARIPANTGNLARRDSIKIPARVAVPQMPDTIEIDVENIKLEPKTPALADLLSPTSTQPSEVRAGSRDTPPPGELSHSHSTTESMNTAGRGSRRARAQVNYAEPNLVSKMRRPTKQLVDAVGGDAKESKRRSSSIEVVKEDQAPLSIVTIKKEPETGKEWKPTTSSVMQELSRPEPQSPIQPKREVRQSPGAALVAEQKLGPQTVASTAHHDEKDLQRKMETMAIFDVQTSSPIKPSSGDAGALQALGGRLGTDKQSAAPIAKTSCGRRQSVLPSTSARSRSISTAKDEAATSGNLQLGQNKSANETEGKIGTVDRGLSARGRRRSTLL